MFLYDSALGYHKDPQTRAAFMEVLTKILQQGTEFETLAETALADRFERLVELVTMIGDKGELPIAMALATVVPTQQMVSGGGGTCQLGRGVMCRWFECSVNIYITLHLCEALNFVWNVQFNVVFYSGLQKSYVSLCVTKKNLLENHLRYMYIYIHFTSACFQKISNIKVQ